MRIVIVGGGVVGSSLAEFLIKDGHTLAMIESDEAIVQHLSNKHDLQVLSGNGSSPELLHEAGISAADLVLAVTPNDEVNIIVCGIAAQHKVKQRIARLRNADYRQDSGFYSLEKLGVTHVINPEKVMVDHILQFIDTPHAVESANFEDGRVLLRGYRLRDNMPICNKTPQEIRDEIERDDILFVAVKRGVQGMIPRGNTRFEQGDILYSLFPREAKEEFLRLVGQGKKKTRKLIVTGDSYAMMEMSKALEGTDNHVTIVDPDLEQANRIAGAFSGIEVVHGETTDVDLLRELNIDNASFFVAVSSIVDYNVLSSLLAKAEGAHEVIATSTETRHDRLFSSIGIDHVINPRRTAAREILEIIARGHIGAVVELANIDIEAARFIVEPESEIAGMKVSSIAKKLKAGTIIGVIVRGDTMIIPYGETTVEQDDHVIVITHHKNLPALASLFKPRGFFSRRK